MLSFILNPHESKDDRLFTEVHGSKLERVDRGIVLKEGDFMDSISLLLTFSSFSILTLLTEFKGEHELSECSGEITVVLSEFDEVVCVVAVESLG
jgi:hypothetical protein